MKQNDMAAHIPTLSPEIIFHIGPFGITNTIINSWIAIIIFLFIGLLTFRRASLKPKKLQNFIEYFLEKLFVYFDEVTGSRKKTLTFLPVVGSVFFFILLSNWLGLLPGTGSILVGHSPLLRPANTDLNLTVSMAFASVLFSHIFGIMAVGTFTHLNKFIQIGIIIISFKKGPIAVFTAIIEFGVGLIELAGEFSKVLSLSLRLFGNVFAGEVLITVISSLVMGIVPVPFMLLEVMVGLIQAAVFTMLTLVYLTVNSQEPHGAEEH